MNVPGIFVYAGTSSRASGKERTHHREPVRAVGAFTAGKMSQEDFEGIEKNACPSVGACGGQYTRQHNVVLVRGAGHEPARLIADGIP